MNVFGDYANYYDLLYSDKDYKGESAYINRMIRKELPKAKTLLNLGCGTGKHDFLLVSHGYEVTGVDLSNDMISIAKKQAASEDNKYVYFQTGDARTFRSEKKFDVVISLFHVLSYQNTDTDVDALFETAKAHLDTGGLFIFDCWYGPAVMSERPSERTKKLENDLLRITRFAKPVMHLEKKIVDVNYDLNIEEKASGKINRFSETHSMRFFFQEEILLAMQKHGFKLNYSEEWMTGNELNDKSWSACFCATKK